jgi:hypothetical protein
MFVSCPAARFHALCVSMCMPTCTRYVCGSAGTSLSRQRALPRTVCMRQRGHFTLKAARHFQSFTHYMHAAARALPLFHPQGSAALSVFHALHACGSAHFTLPLSRQRGGTWACLYVGGDGLSDCSALSLFGLRSSRWSVSCGPAALRVWFVLSCCQRCIRHDLAPPMSAAMPAAALAAATREVALEAWRWRLGAGGLALEAWRWRPRGPSPCVAVLLARCLRCLSLLARRGSAWHAAW